MLYQWLESVPAAVAALWVKEATLGASAAVAAAASVVVLLLHAPPLAGRYLLQYGCFVLLLLMMAGTPSL